MGNNQCHKSRVLLRGEKMTPDEANTLCKQLEHFCQKLCPVNAEWSTRSEDENTNAFWTHCNQCLVEEFVRSIIGWH
jgi:hypothetical protein